MALGNFQESVPLCSLPFVFVIFVSLVFCCLYNIHFVRCMMASVIRGKISMCHCAMHQIFPTFATVLLCFVCVYKRSRRQMCLMWPVPD